MHSGQNVVKSLRGYCVILSLGVQRKQPLGCIEGRVPHSQTVIRGRRTDGHTQPLLFCFNSREGKRNDQLPFMCALRGWGLYLQPRRVRGPVAFQFTGPSSNQLSRPGQGCPCFLWVMSCGTRLPSPREPTYTLWSPCTFSFMSVAD